LILRIVYLEHYQYWNNIEQREITDRSQNKIFSGIQCFWLELRVSPFRHKSVEKRKVFRKQHLIITVLNILNK